MRRAKQNPQFRKILWILDVFAELYKKKIGQRWQKSMYFWNIFVDLGPVKKSRYLTGKLGNHGNLSLNLGDLPLNCRYLTENTVFSG